MLQEEVYQVFQRAGQAADMRGISRTVNRGKFASRHAAFRQYVR